MDQGFKSLHTLQACPAWSVWNAWSECSASCDGGLRSRARTCISGEPGDIGCSGATMEQEYCQGQVCVDIALSLVSQYINKLF